MIVITVIAGLTAIAIECGYSNRYHRYYRIIAAIACALLGACVDRPTSDADRNDAATPDTGGTAVVALAGNLDVANGLLSADVTTQEIIRTLLFLPLLTYQPDLQLEPLLARSWQLEGDTAVVLQLRDDVRWHDGVTTTAYDVEFTYRYGVDPKTAYPNADYWEGWNRAEVLDSFTIRFSITPQREALANLPWISVMPRHLLESTSPAELSKAAFNQQPVGNGPFRFVDYRPNDRWVFEANRDYPAGLGGRPNLDRVVFRIIPDESAREAELIAGAVDLIANVRPERFEALDAYEQVRSIAKPGRQYAMIAWNGRRPPLDDARVRRALTMAMNRERMVALLWRGRAQVAAGPVPPFHWAYDDAVKPLPYAPDSARALLAAAGIGDRNGDGVVDLPNGSPFRIELKLPANNRLNADIAEMIRADLAEVGVRVTTRPTEYSTMVGDVVAPERKFEAVLMGWESDFKLVLRDQFHSAAINNQLQFASYRNPDVDRLLDQLDATMSREAAAPLWRRLQTIMRDEEPWTFLFYYGTVFGVRERLQDVDMDIRGWLISAPQWWLRQ